MNFKSYCSGDEGNTKLSLYNSKEVFTLNESVMSIWENNKVIAFIEMELYDDGTLLIYSFETIQKYVGNGKRIISCLQNYDDVKRIIVQPTHSSVDFWIKMNFTTVTYSGDELQWSKYK